MNSRLNPKWSNTKKQNIGNSTTTTWSLMRLPADCKRAFYMRPTNIMFNKKVVRGNTYAASVLQKNKEKKDSKIFKKPIIKSIVMIIIDLRLLKKSSQHNMRMQPPQDHYRADII